ncbi:MAG: tetratricopeptide repeat protein [Pseudomonadota bacterium]
MLDKEEEIRTRPNSPEVEPERQHEYTANQRIRWGLVGLVFVVSILTLVVLNYPGLQSPMIYDSGLFIAAKSDLFQANNLWEVIRIFPARPLLMATFYLNHLTTGMNPLYFRVVNIVLTAGAGASLSLLIFLVLDLGGPRDRYSYRQKLGVSLLLGYVFVIHPLQTLATLYIWQRGAILTCLFYYTSVAVYLACRSGRFLSPLSGYGLTGLLFLAGLLCKENIATVPAVLLLAEVVLFRRRISDMGGSVIRIGALFIVSVILYYVVTKILTGSSSTEGYSSSRVLVGYFDYAGLSLAEVLLTESRAFFLYLASILFPIPGTIAFIKAMTVSRSLPSPPVTAVACAGVAGLVGLGIYLIRRRPIAAFGILFFVISLIPETTLLPHYLFFGYRAILPMAGVLIILGGFMVGAVAVPGDGSGVKASRIASAVFAVLVVVGLMAGTHLRAASWNPMFLWRDAYERLPADRTLIEKKPYLDVLLNLTVLMARGGNLHGAEELCRESLTFHPGESISALIELGNAWLAANNMPKAIATYKKAIELKPTLPQPYVNLGAAYANSGQYENARNALEKAVKLDPRHSKAQANLGITLINLGLFTEAIKHLSQAVQLDPSLAMAHLQLGIAWHHAGEPARAVKPYERALRHMPRSVDARMRLAKALAVLKRYPESMDQYRHILRVDPDNYKAHSDLAHLLIGVSEFDKAIAHCRRALSIRPDFGEARANLDLALELSGGEPAKANESGGAALR